MQNGFISNYMKRAIELAQKGRGFVNPNPLVGAVLVKDSKIIGEGFHRCYGQLHAERDAIADAKMRGNSCQGAELFVTLEPCCHFGKQPPCTQAIIDEGIEKVFVGSDDPNPLVCGKGIEALAKAGVEVVRGVLKDECDALNPVFFHYIKTGTPYITMKYAVSADGLTSCCTGDSKWISSDESRYFVHQERAENMAVMTGIQTVISDDPLLNCRLPKKTEARQPVRIVCDSTLRIPLDCNLVKTAAEFSLVIACALNDEEIAASEKAHALEKCGAKIIACVGKAADFAATTNDSACPQVDLVTLAQKLGEMKIDSVLLESGGTLNYSALKAGIVQKIQIFIAPKILGCSEKVFSPVRGIIANHPDEAIKLSAPKVQLIGSDVLLEYEVL